MVNTTNIYVPHHSLIRHMYIEYLLYDEWSTSARDPVGSQSLVQPSWSLSWTELCPPQVHMLRSQSPSASEYDCIWR